LIISTREFRNFPWDKWKKPNREIDAVEIKTTPMISLKKRWKYSNSLKALSDLLFMDD
jgi:hypothetical protein